MIRIFLLYKKIVNKIKLLLCQKSAIYQLKKANAIVAPGITFIGENTLYIAGKVRIGKNFICRTGPEGHSKIFVYKDAELQIGDNSGTNNITILCKDKIVIGNYVNIGNSTYIYDSNFHSLDWKKRENRVEDVNNAKNAPIHIGDYVFIGARCIIGKGVTIGNKSIVAAGSVVTRDIPAGEIWGGNPAKFIKFID